jgi:polypyrimidine tract-binding protein 2
MGGIGGSNDFYAQQAAAAAAQQQNVYFPSAAFMNAASSQFNSVLLVSNLNEEKINCTSLFNLFSSYGNVMRVKILHNKPDHALVQMGDYAQASTAMHYLKGLVLWDKPMDINFSKHSYISSTSNDPNDPTSADYTNSPLNRFKFSQGTEKAQQIYKSIFTMRVIKT